nr:hypothetical protein [uncultured Carboxylicivirga sp.]
MKNLNELGVQEMEAKEMKKTDGGIVLESGFLWLGLMTAAGFSAGQEDRNK